MKTNFRFLALSAAILSMFTACQREELEQNQKPEALTHSVTFVAGAPETKTTATIDGSTVNYAWTADDENRFTVFENGTAAKEVLAELGTDGKMSMTATFLGDVPASPKYQALYNSEVSATQIVSENSYAEVSDVMVSNVLDGTRDNTFVFSFKREVAFAKMTLKDLTSGAYVSSVTIESDKPIAGKYDLKTGTFVNTSNVIKLDVLNDVVDGNATVWFTTIPVEDATFTITAETTNDLEAVAATYTKTFSKTITLTRGDVKAFGVAMTKDVVVKPWVAVELADIDETMPLVITMATTDKTYALSLTGTDDNALGTSKAPKAIEVSVVDGKLSEEPSSDILWNIANNNGNLTIYPNGVTEKWLYTTDRNDGVRLGTNTSNGYVWSIDAESGYLKANSTSTSTKVRYLGVYVTGQDWRAYTNTTGNTAGQTLRFYSNSITEDPTAPKLSVTPTSKTWASVETDAAVFNVTTNTEGEKDWKVSPETLGWATIAVNKTAGTITVTPKDANTAETAREATLTVSHSAGTLSETITLTQKAAGTVQKVQKTAQITFGTNNVKIDKDSVTANDDCGNSWTITTSGTTSFTTNADYYQVGSKNKPATSITFTTTLPSDAEVGSIEAKFGGFRGTAGTVSLKVGDTSVGSGSLNADNDVTVSSTSTAKGNVVTVSVTGISKGVKCYYIKVGYQTAE